MITTMVVCRSGRTLLFKRDGKAIPLNELKKECEKEGIDVLDRDAVPFVTDFEDKN